MKWYSVKDKLPDSPDFDPKERCCHDAVWLCATKGSQGPGPLYGIGQYSGDGKWEIVGQEGLYSDTGTWPFSSEDVTHWRWVEEISLDEMEINEPKIALGDIATGKRDDFAIDLTPKCINLIIK